ncbi:phosphocholine-specific phospholipase C [Xanthomonas arboricola]|uniref:phosphocholine-specific phospholipase C n=1 Tax=Xanthomonas arboricola TaxID=56448 RepID=UPI001AF74F2A|nr:phospholipase C, phosphocholine-specific [Xanthomonas arboricola]CAD7378422.1 phospholipase C, phosphocholine-specific [Xanthomonas arboricola]CAG2086549.1 phospholipase C, phosphocholine-specific [Xanthomonas arboricola pv. juglandis]
MTSSPSRRDFLKRVAALTAAGALPSSIGRALALPANSRTGTLRDIEHVVILMQENRSFDHYFGALRGVRGFGDPRPLQLRDGHPVWSQPAADGRRLLPFAFDSQSTCAPLIKSLDHSWKAGHGQDPARWAEYDAWVPYKGELTMGYFQRHDIPYYHALADAFTICDGYFCSLHGPTNPNRMYLFTGTSGPSVGNLGAQAVTNADDGNWTADMARDKPGYAAMDWTTYAQRLQAAGVDWRVYQEYDNFGCNSLAYFSHYRDLHPSDERYRRARACVPGSTADNAATTQAEHLIAAIAADVQADRLPQVSWIVPPTAYCEHPEAPPAYGESLVARLIDALTANPQVWAKTALIINYDENDGFFDHVPAALPALDARMGRSNVDTRGEVYEGVPMGLGIRVPMLVISPWTRGGWVNSQVFDHTSVLRLLERRFGVAEPNISPWRRAVSGDLTSVFDFRKPDDSALRALPSVDDYRARTAAVRNKPLPVPPAQASMPRQEPGQRPARALPYALQVHAREQGDGGVQLQFVNSGAAAAAFNVYTSAASGGPWYYTVLPGTRLDDVPVGAAHNGGYALSVHGPNGFLREFAGDLAAAGTQSAAPWLEARQDGEVLVLDIGNAGQQPCTLQLRALDYADPTARSLHLAAGQRQTVRLALAASDHWYDVVLEQPGAAFRRRLAGHLETGRPSRSDPAFGRA